MYVPEAGDPRLAGAEAGVVGEVPELEVGNGQQVRRERLD